jgi:hypothetical protein
VNILVPFLRDHRQFVDRLIDTDEQVSSFDRVIDATEDVDLPFVLNRDIAADLTRGQPNGHVLRRAYLPIIAHERWLAQVQSADPPSPPDENPRAIHEHATFVRGDASTQGVSLPDDDDFAFQRVSLFARGGDTDALQRVNIEYAHGPGMPTGVSISLAHGCSLPDWGRCREKDCSGDCRLARVHNDDDGLVCHCPHMM